MRTNANQGNFQNCKFISCEKEDLLTLSLLKTPCPNSVTYQGQNYNVTNLGGLCWTCNLANKFYADSIESITFAKVYTCENCPDSITMESIFGLLYSWYSAVGVPEGLVGAQPLPNANGFV